MYKFEIIIPKQNVEYTDAVRIYERTEEISLKDDNYERIDNLVSFLKNIGSKEGFYLLHDYCVVKGKTKIFKGDTIKIDKKTLLDYLQKCNELNDFRPLRIISVQESTYTIIVNDEGTGYLCGVLS